MSLSDRDRKLLLAIVPIALVVAFWFLLLAPKREDAAAAEAALAKAQDRHAAAEQKLALGTVARREFATDYAQVVRLGKAVPSEPDVPSLIVQIEDAAKGTGVQFDKVALGPRVAAGPTGASASASAAAGPGAGGSAASSSAGGAQPSGSGAAASGAGKAGNTASGAAANANQAAPAAGGQGAAASSSASASGGSGATTTTTARPSPVEGLDTVPVELSFKGDFYDLADFFHRMKRFVRLANDRLEVTGRLIDVDGVTFDTTDGLGAEIKATIYLAPKTQGATAGATPNGPAGTAPAAAGGSPRGDSAFKPPTAAVTR